MTGEQLNFKKHLSLQVGQYCQVHDQETPCNSMAVQTHGAIALSPSGNLQGGFKFMALDTGQKITRYSWDALPAPDVIIKHVNKLGKDMPVVLTFYN